MFVGNAALCGRLCYELLKCCNSRLSSIRQESCAILYLLMRSNFEFTSRKGLTRVHLQVIISVSQMLGNIVGLNNSRFQESLSLINSYASSDKAMKGTGKYSYLISYSQYVLFLWFHAIYLFLFNICHFIDTITFTVFLTFKCFLKY